VLVTCVTAIHGSLVFLRECDSKRTSLWARPARPIHTFCGSSTYRHSVKLEPTKRTALCTTVVAFFLRNNLYYSEKIRNYNLDHIT
jgi:hypothetical protein